MLIENVEILKREFICDDGTCLLPGYGGIAITEEYLSQTRNDFSRSDYDALLKTSEQAIVEGAVYLYFSGAGKLAKVPRTYLY